MTATSALRAQLDGEVLDRASEDYDSARRVFNGLFDRRPALIARCRSAADVSRCIRFARERDLPVSVRGGGHSIAGYSVVDDGLVIDLSSLRAVHVDAANRRAQVGGGALWADVDRETQRFGLATPGGVVSLTGVGGLTLSGGIGWLRNAYGLSCDNVQRVELVTAAGEVLSASATRNADLFWALRGGGGNFGVVTSFEFALHGVGPDVAALFPVFPLKNGRAVLQAWREWALATPREISSEVVLWTAPESAAFPTGAHNRPVVIPGAVYAGNAVRGAALLDPMCEFAEPIGVIGGALPYCGVQAAFDASFPNTGELCSYWKSLYLHELTDAALDVLVNATHHRTSPATMVVVQHIGGAVHDVAASESAFAARSAPFLINLMGTWRDPDDSARHIAWVKNTWCDLSALGTATPYLNYMSEELADADALIRKAHGANYERLASIKSKYDPDNVWRLNQNITPAKV